MASTKRKTHSLSVSLDLPGLRGCFFVWPQAPLIVLALVILVSGFYFAQQSGSDAQVYSNDFNVFYHAAREVVAGRDPYQSSLSDWAPFLYTPLLAVVLAPLALLPLPVAAYIWFLINAASTIAAAWMSARLAGYGSRPRDPSKDLDEVISLHTLLLVPMAAAVSLLIVTRFVLDNFSLGQVNPLVAALAAAHVYLYSRNKKTASALMLAIAASIKLTPLVLLGYYIARRRWKFSAACLGLSVVISALSFLPFGSQAPDAFHIFVSRTIQNEQGYDFAYAGNQSLRGAIARLTPEASRRLDHAASESSRRPSDPVTLLISLALVAVGMLAASRAPTEVLAAAPFVSCFVLLSPLSWKAHFVVLVFPVASLIAQAARTRGTRRGILTAVVAVAFALFNFTSPAIIGLRAAEWADAHSLVFIGALLIFTASVWAARVAPKG